MCAKKIRKGGISGFVELVGGGFKFRGGGRFRVEPSTISWDAASRATWMPTGFQMVLKTRYPSSTLSPLILVVLLRNAEH